MTFLHHVGAATKAPGITTKSIKGADFQGDPLGEDFVDFAVDSLIVINGWLQGGGGGGLSLQSRM